MGDLSHTPMLSASALEVQQMHIEGIRATHWRFPPCQVLVVDDGAENRELVRLVLEEAGLRVVEAETANVPWMPHCCGPSTWS